MKKSFKIKLKVKGCDKEFKEGMGKGVLASKVATFPAEQSSHNISVGLYELGQEFIDELIEIEIEEE